MSDPFTFDPAALADLQRRAREMALALRPEPMTRRFVGRRLAVVTAVNAGPPLTADVTLDGASIPGVAPQSSYRPIVDDFVWLEMVGTEAHISAPLATDGNRKWNTLTLNGGSGWLSVGNPYAVPGYWRDPTGMVFLRGAAKSGTTITNIATLPAGFRPPTNCEEILPVAINGGTSTVSVASNGDVLYLGPTTPTYVGLGSIRFRID